MKGPSRKDESQQKPMIRHDYSSKEICKIKCKNSPQPITYDEAKASCKARKRKERQESISSLCQERKVIRSNSEERPSQRKHLDSKASMRRVSSSEDFQKTDSRQHFDGSSSPKRQSSTDIILIYEDFEHERRRSHERFSKPLALKGKRVHRSRKPKARCLPKPKFKPEIAQAAVVSNGGGAAQDPSLKHETIRNQGTTTAQEKLDDVGSGGDLASTEIEVKFLQLHAKEKERSPSPVRNNFSPDLDLTTLHEQVDCSEPLLSCANHQINDSTETLPGLSVASNRLLLSPRNSIIATHRIYLDPDVPGGFLENKTQNPLELRLHKITKQINSAKKKIKKYEVEFETQHGYKLSHADKLNDKNVRKLYLELSKLKKEQKHLVDVCPTTGGAEESSDHTKHSRNLHDTLNDIEKRLIQKREAVNRPSSIEQMTSEELSEEKIAVQKALLYLESIHGRPDGKDDRDLVRPIYDRYRNLKRMISKVQANSTGNELATIHEDETMHFITSFPPQSATEIDSEKSSMLTSTDSSDTDTSISENLHSLTKVELIEQHRLVSEEKKEFRRAIKTFELEFQQKFGRMVQKEDKLPLEHVYVGYKKVKAKLKLLDALVGKQL